MTELKTQDSIKFPPGYGDFMLQCSDGVVCHFPRYLLEHMSPVFKDMFVVSNHDSMISPNSSPLVLVEGSGVIELLLEHIDPRSKRILPIHPENIFNLLEAARKYQITNITEWFTEQAALRQIDTKTGGIKEPFTFTHPNLALKCAVRFELSYIGRLALRELAGVPFSELLREGNQVSTFVYKYLCQLRETRVERYRRHIDSIANTLAYCVNPPCQSCFALGANWVLSMDRAVSLSPRWQTFLKSFGAERKCGESSCKRKPLQNFYSTLIVKWEKIAKEEESVLPGWPLVYATVTSGIQTNVH